jgi:hypothetical protein
MNRSSGSRNPPSKLSDSIHHRLNMYALATSAAGVGVLALGPSADARVVYTPAHKKIAPNHTVSIDLNHDGKMDFRIHDSFACTSFCEYIVGAITVIPARQGNEILGYPGRSRNYASALNAGVHVGPKRRFSPGNQVMVSGGYDAGTNTMGACFGPWKNLQHRYLGLKFTVNGKIHYGWARLNETCAKNGSNTAVLTGFAYETIANKPIITGRIRRPDVIPTQARDSALTLPPPEPATLGLLAMGAPGLSIWRRKEELAAA